MIPPMIVAGRPISTTANGAVGALTMSPMTSPATAPITPAQVAPMAAQRLVSGRRFSSAAISWTRVGLSGRTNGVLDTVTFSSRRREQGRCGLV